MMNRFFKSVLISSCFGLFTFIIKAEAPKPMQASIVFMNLERVLKEHPPFLAGQELLDDESQKKLKKIDHQMDEIESSKALVRSKPMMISHQKHLF